MNDNLSEILRVQIEKLPNVATRPMFGYHCYLVEGKFFVGFNKKHKSEVIIRLSKEMQKDALADVALQSKPFSHGAKMGWVAIEITNKKKVEATFAWVKKGYEHALELSRQ